MATEQFEERISFFENEMDHINVSFSHHAGIYRLEANQENFMPCAQNMLTAWKDKKPARIGLNGQKIAFIELIK